MPDQFRYPSLDLLQVPVTQAVGDVDHHDIRLEEHRGLDEEGRLGVKKALPPIADDELRNDHADRVVRGAGRDQPVRNSQILMRHPVSASAHGVRLNRLTVGRYDHGEDENHRQCDWGVVGDGSSPRHQEDEQYLIGGVG